MSDRISELAALLKELMNGGTPEEAEKNLISELKEIDPAELAAAENLLVEEGIGVEDIQRANQIHADLVIGRMTGNFRDKIGKFETGHPIRVFAGENRGISVFLNEQLLPDIRKFLATESDTDREDLIYDAQELMKIIRHYDRKENLLFPYLERNGITAPPKVMWGVDDIIRQLLGLFKDAVTSDKASAKRIKLIADRLLPQIETMIIKENEILLPMLLPLMSDSDWLLVAKESVHIGYVFNKGIEGSSNSDAATWINSNEDGCGSADLKYRDEINLPSGFMSTDQMTAMLNTLPTDLTFIDDEDIIRYYSEGKHQVFTRTRTIIGRNVYLCHPPKLVPVIRNMIEDFRSGRKDSQIVPVRKGSKLDLVRYYAVRDDEGTYIGTLEVTEEISGIIDLVRES
ncbi:MAG: DUF438 domain-containing protein [Eubacteriales bacterium]|nr:DUF438 domain-containing protein [Eubacteriales bacterium]